MKSFNSVLFIPTKDRPNSLFNVLNFLKLRYENVIQICIADGSSEATQELIASRIAQLDLAVTHLRFDSCVGFFDRVLAGLDSVSESMIVMGADDDFPLLPTLFQCESLLEQENDAVSVMGSTLELYFGERETIRARLNVTRSLLDPEPWLRALAYARWPFATTYGVTRKTHLVARYQWLSQLATAGYFDYCGGLFDAIEGQIIAVPFLTNVGTRNFVHSYWRPEARVGWRSLSDLQDVVAAFRIYAQEKAGDDRRDVDAIVDRLWLAQFRRILGDRVQLRPNFGTSRLMNDPGVVAQIDQFEQLMRSGAMMDGALKEELELIMHSVKMVIREAGEMSSSGNYDTIE